MSGCLQRYDGNKWVNWLSVRNDRDINDVIEIVRESEPETKLRVLFRWFCFVRTIDLFCTHNIFFLIEIKTVRGSKP